MAVAEKLELLRSTKSNIKAAIEEKGQEVGEIPFSQYPEKIRAIEGGGGGGGGASTPPDPVEVYKNTRPKDWLPMPEPADNEMYLLVHIPDGASALLAFTVTCTPMPGTYSVYFGSVQNGQFVPASYVSEPNVGTYETELFADDFGNLTSDGFKQVMVKISAFPGKDILTWEPAEHSKMSGYFRSWPIVEISCRLPTGAKVTCGNSSEFNALKNLRYFSWVGNNEVTDMSDMFENCYSLIAIPQLDTSKVTNMFQMFENCYSLIAIPQLDTSLTENMGQMFYSCYSLKTIPQLDTSSVENMGSMFGQCYSLIAIPQLDTSVVTNMGSMFGQCYSLIAIPQLDTSVVEDMEYMFTSCESLALLRLNPSVIGWEGCDISLSNCSLGHLALIALFESLPTMNNRVRVAPPHGTSLALYGNPGVSELTDEEKAIATDKGWDLVV